MLRFIHLTDTHIGPSPDFTLYGRQPLPWLVRAVDAINALPFTPDFVLHSGDVTDDGSEASYRLAGEQLRRLRVPVRYAIGNHDHPEHLQRVLLQSGSPLPRFDYRFSVGGVEFAVLDTRGPVDPGGELTDAQLQYLQELCTPSGPPLVIVVHHHPIALDADWLDGRGSDWPVERYMRLRNGAAMRAVLAPARARIAGVFFGHVHARFSAVVDGILYCAAPSGFANLKSWPPPTVVVPAPDQPPGFNVVTLADGQTLVRSIAIL